MFNKQFIRDLLDAQKEYLEAKHLADRTNDYHDIMRVNKLAYNVAELNSKMEFQTESEALNVVFENIGIDTLMKEASKRLSGRRIRVIKDKSISSRENGLKGGRPKKVLA